MGLNGIYDEETNSCDDDFNYFSFPIPNNWESLLDSETDDMIDVCVEDEDAKYIDTAEEQETMSDEDIWIQNVVDEIHNAYSTLDNQPLYDTSFDEPIADQSIEDSIHEDMDDEIAMLVRCNERPDSLLIEEGRALPPLGEEEMNDVSQLVVWNNDAFEATAFLKYTVSRLFRWHAVPSVHDGILSMDRACIASWMTQSLREEEKKKISQHDRRVSKTLSDFSEYGSGRIVEENFQNLYLRHIIGDTKTLSSLSAKHHLKLRKHFRDAVWRDIRAHGMISPKEEERFLLLEKIDLDYSESNPNGYGGDSNAEIEEMFINECEIFDWDHNAPIPKKKDQHGQHCSRPSSHKLVEMANDKITPLRIRDGDFVFIDEESCIGCMQCANIAPSSFFMMDSGRARTFKQRLGVDVEQAVDVCPVSCMHRVSFHELKVFEIARDEGDGKEDDKHSPNRGHTPLHVTRIDSDNNHRSSLYHTLKAKCVTSSDCPKKGCYDCPCYRNPGENPFFIAKHKHAEHIRAQHFIKNGEARLFRRAIDL